MQGINSSKSCNQSLTGKRISVKVLSPSYMWLWILEDSFFLCVVLFFSERRNIVFLELIESKRELRVFCSGLCMVCVLHMLHRVTAAMPIKYGLFSAYRSLEWRTGLDWIGLDQFGWVWKVCLYISIFLFNIHKFSLVLGIKWVIKTTCSERKNTQTAYCVFL